MNGEEPTDLGQQFLTEYRKKTFQDPDDSLMDTRDARWPTNWQNRVQGMPNMQITAPERRANYNLG